MHVRAQAPEAEQVAVQEQELKGLSPQQKHSMVPLIYKGFDLCASFLISNRKKEYKQLNSAAWCGNSLKSSNLAFLSSSCFVLTQRSHFGDEMVQGHPTAAIPTQRLRAAVNKS